MGCTVGKYPAALVLYFLCMGLWYPILAQELSHNKLKIINVTISKGELGETANISCEVKPENATIEWLLQGVPLDVKERINITISKKELNNTDSYGNKLYSSISTLRILNVSRDDERNYTCLAKLAGSVADQTKLLNLSFWAKLFNKTALIKRNIAKNESRDVTMMCIFEVYTAVEVIWTKKGKSDEKDQLLKEDKKPIKLNAKQIQSAFTYHIKNGFDGGAYVCEIWDPVSRRRVSGTIELIIVDKPILLLDKIIAINTTHVYLNWTVQTFGSQIQQYSLMQRENNDSWMQSPYEVTKRISPENTSYVLGGLKPNTTYRFKMVVKTAAGVSEERRESENVTTLAKEPIFIPNIFRSGFSATSVSISWAPPPDELANLIHYYKLTVSKMGDANISRTYYFRHRFVPITDLKPYSTYIFQVQACSDYTKTCGPPSVQKIEMVTSYDIPGIKYTWNIEDISKQGQRNADTRNGDEDGHTPGYSKNNGSLPNCYNQTTPSLAANQSRNYSRDYIEDLLQKCETNAREDYKEMKKIFVDLERERIRLRDIELRQRETELQLQAQWMELFRKGLDVLDKYITKEEYMKELKKYNH